MNRRDIVQVAYIVEDIHKAMREWREKLGVGPFFLFENFSLEDMIYRGKASELNIDLAMCFSGGMVFEFIEQKDKTRSVYTEVIEQSGYGFHHWAIRVHDLDRAIKEYGALGCDLAMCGRVAALDARAAYIDMIDETGGMLELIEVAPKVDEFFGNLKIMSDEWDGSRLVIPMAL
ncbi:MAG: VOC family protein [Sphingopyxis sp.]|jgi:hypothetical protein|nr:VOC family protein [Sphingopyxis sp.]